MVSLPDETMEDFNKTLELIKFFDGVNLQFFKIHPNTPFYDELKQNGEIDDEVWFDPDRGVDTIYGNEIYYCKDVFSSAPFYRDEAEALLCRVNQNPQKAIQRHGLAKGVLILPLLVILNVLLRVKMGRRFYNKLRNASILKILYKRLAE